MTRYYMPTESYLSQLRQEYNNQTFTYNSLQSDGRISRERLLAAEYRKTFALTKWFNFQTILRHGMTIPVPEWTLASLQAMTLKQLRDIFSNTPFIGAELRDPLSFKQLNPIKRDTYTLLILDLQERYSDCPVFTDTRLPD